jgi:hypothetical protein
MNGTGSKNGALERARALTSWAQQADVNAPPDLIRQLANVWAAMQRADAVFTQMAQRSRGDLGYGYLSQLDVHLFDDLQVHLEELKGPLRAFVDQGGDR